MLFSLGLLVIVIGFSLDKIERFRHGWPLGPIFPYLCAIIGIGLMIVHFKAKNFALALFIIGTLLFLWNLREFRSKE